METLTQDEDIDGVTYSSYVLSADDLTHLVRLACLSFYRAAHLVADYSWIDKSPLESWAERAPEAWFTVPA